MFQPTDEIILAEQLKQNAAEIQNTPPEKRDALYDAKRKLLEPNKQKIFNNIKALTEHRYVIDAKGEFVFTTANFPIHSPSVAMDDLVQRNIKSLEDAGIHAELKKAGEDRTISVDPAQEGFFTRLKAALAASQEVSATR